MQFNFINPVIDIRASRGFVKDIYDPAIAVREPLSDYQTMLDVIRRDPIIAAAFDIVVDFSTFRGYDFIQGSKTQRDKSRDKFEELNWLQIDRNLKYASLAYGDAFLELRDLDNDNSIDELHPLESTEMRIIYDKHGTIEGFVQRPFSLSGLDTQQILDKEASQGIHFTPEQVIHLRTKWIGSQVYSYNPMEAASTQISTKLLASNYLMNIFQTMPPRYLVHLAGASDKQRKSLKFEWQNTKTNPKRNVLFSSAPDPNSSLKIEKIDPIYDQDLLNSIKFVRNEILSLTRVPRSWVDESAVENRGVTEAEQRPFDVRVMSLQKDPYEIAINNQLLPRLFKTKGNGATNKLKYRYNAISIKNEKETILNAGMLRDMGLKQPALVRYLDDRGILGFDPTDFEMDQLKKAMELNGSRMREDKSTDDMKNNLDSQGVSSAGEAKSKEIATRFGQHPYTMA